MKGSTSVCHGIDKVVDPDPEAEIGETLRISRLARPFPGISDIGIEADCDHDPAFIIVDRAPVRAFSIARTPRIIRHLVPKSQMRGTGNLNAVVKIVECVEYRIAIW